MNNNKEMSLTEKLLLMSKLGSSGGGGGGSALPEVTSADNGKVLTVVDGAWDKAEAAPVIYGYNNYVTGESYLSYDPERTHAIHICEYAEVLRKNPLIVVDKKPVTPDDNLRFETYLYAFQITNRDNPWDTFFYSLYSYDYAFSGGGMGSEDEYSFTHFGYSNAHALISLVIKVDALSALQSGDYEFVMPRYKTELTEMAEVFEAVLNIPLGSESMLHYNNDSDIETVTLQRTSGGFQLLNGDEARLTLTEDSAVFNIPAAVVESLYAEEKGVIRISYRGVENSPT